MHYKTLVLGMWLGVQLHTIRRHRQGGVGPSGSGVYEGPEVRILRFVGYVFLSPQWKGHGAALYDSFDIEAVAQRVV